MNKILKIVLTFIILIVTSILVVECWYLPRYLFNRNTIEVNTNNEQIRIMSMNVRNYDFNDKFKKSVFYRNSLLNENIQEVQPDIIGFQEYSWLHHNYFKDTLKGYDYVLTYRDKFIVSEGCPIFYRTDKFS